MKKVTLNLCALAVIILGLAAISASAQSAGHYRTHIPFAFTVDGQAFQAGDYRISVLNPESDKAILSLRSVDGREGRLIMTTPKQVDPRKESSQLVFNRFEGQYILMEMSIGDFGVEIRGARTASAVAKRRINTDPRREVVALLWLGK